MPSIDMIPPCRIYPQKIGSEDDVIDRIRLHFVVKNSMTAAKIAFLSSKSRLKLELNSEFNTLYRQNEHHHTKPLKGAVNNYATTGLK